MLCSISIENFKGISDLITIPIRPITLLFGANSAGKSTVIQAIHYFRELLLNKNVDADRTDLGGEFLDLGGFYSMVNSHDLSKEIKIKLEFEVNDDSLEPFEGAIYNSTKSIDPINEFLSVKTAYVELTVAHDGKHPIIKFYSVGLNGNLIGTLGWFGDYVGIHELNLSHTLFDNMAESKINEEDIEGSNEEKKNEAFSKYFSTYIEQDGRDITEPVFFENLKSIIPPEDELLIIKAQESDDDSTYGNEYVSHLISRLFVRPADILREFLFDLKYIGPVREIPPRNYAPFNSPEMSGWSNGFEAWDLLHRKGSEFVQKCSAALTDIVKLGYSLTFTEYIHLYKNDLAYKNIELLSRNLEDWEENDINNRILTPLKAKQPFLKIVVKDEVKNIDVELPEIGVGVSQAVPVVVAVLDNETKFLAIEQPELHLHPAVQCNLADVFIKEANKSSNKIFLIELHSEHFILRLLKRIRECNVKLPPDNHLIITPDKVAVIHVEKREDDTVIKELSINKDGEFEDEWPGGFFEERTKEWFD
ncbi:DUF3696 domain-containing protein [Fibrobacterota bacterium]